ncbi:hypothetical protein RHMOL_Rhmol04G0119900 [Rhododendron molle]|uniref:Uncharacterized protein n=1 Tax=Rhododendron molle TaxID=49168 RepID=A0ACC0NZM5_RHOML|nr:hypothetical protein RHMOL_Rhmol04G0119900 [Rhododendron molle]
MGCWRPPSLLGSSSSPTSRDVVIRQPFFNSHSKPQTEAAMKIARRRSPFIQLGRDGRSGLHPQLTKTTTVTFLQYFFRIFSWFFSFS